MTDWLIAGGFAALYLMTVTIVLWCWRNASKLAAAEDARQRRETEQAIQVEALLTPDAPALDDAKVRRQLQRLDCNQRARDFSRARHAADRVPFSEARARAWDDIQRDLEGINR
jgi:type VI protein secretion system component VasK